jgi:sodium-independent organic anion transporter
MFVLGLGAVIFMLPSIAVDSSNIGVAANPLGTLCASGDDTGECDAGSSMSAFGIFCFAQVVIAIGATPLYPLVGSWLDLHVSSTDLPLYLGTFYASNAVGPAIGFLGGGATLSLYVDPSAGVTPAKTSPQWIGAWWAGFLVCAVVAVAGSIRFCFFPNNAPPAPKAQQQQQGHDDDDDDGGGGEQRQPQQPQQPQPGPEGLSASVLAVLRSPAAVFSMLGGATETFVVSSFSSYLPKEIEQQFGVSPGLASILTGAVVVPGFAGGIFFGGWVCRRFQYTREQVAKFCWRAALLAIMFTPVYSIGCGRSTDEILGNGDGSCSGLCNCSETLYRPVCGADGQTYASACAAGCREEAPGTYAGCQCLAGFHEANASSTGMATLGKCASGDDCGLDLALFCLLLFGSMVTTSVNNTPANLTQLKALEEKDRAVGLAVASILARLFGSIPGPVILGAFIDRACLQNAGSCDGAVGHCTKYSLSQLRSAFALLFFAGKGLSFLFFFVSWRYVRGEEDSRYSRGAGACPLKITGARSAVEMTHQPGLTQDPRAGLVENQNHQVETTSVHVSVA